MNSFESRVTSMNDRKQREFALWCARRVKHLMRDPRAIASLDIAEAWLSGEASPSDLRSALNEVRNAEVTAFMEAKTSPQALASWRAIKAAARACAGQAIWAARAAASACEGEAEEQELELRRITK